MIQHFNVKRLEVGICSDDVAMVAFTADLKKSKNKDPIRLLYLTPPENFDSIMRRAKNYILADEALDSSDNEEHEPSKRQQKKIRGEKPSNKRTSTQKSPPPPRRYTSLNSPRFEIMDYIKEGYTIQTPRPIRSPHETRRNKDLYYRYHRDYRSDTENSYHLKDEIEKLIAKGHLNPPNQEEIGTHDQ